MAGRAVASNVARNLNYPDTSQSLALKMIDVKIVSYVLLGHHHHHLCIIVVVVAKSARDYVVGHAGSTKDSDARGGQKTLMHVGGMPVRQRTQMHLNARHRQCR